MLKFQRISLQIDPSFQSSAYISLILPFVYPLLITPDPHTHWVAIEAHLDGELVALSLSQVSEVNQIARLYSLVVKPEHRQKGIGKQLFSFTQDLLAQEEKIRCLTIEYEQSDPFIAAIEKILVAQGWPPAQLYLIRCHFILDQFNPYWFRAPYRLPSPMQLFDWKDLTRSDRKQIDYLYQQGRFLSYLSPLHHEEQIHMETSVGLRHHEKVIGWSITYKIDPTTIRYAILYIDNAFLHTGYGIQLVLESIRRQKQLPIPKAIFEVNLKEIDPSWWRFVKKRLIPLAYEVERWKWATYLFNI